MRFLFCCVVVLVLMCMFGRFVSSIVLFSWVCCMVWNICVVCWFCVWVLYFCNLVVSCGVCGVFWLGLIWLLWRCGGLSVYCELLLFVIVICCLLCGMYVVLVFVWWLLVSGVWL